MPDVHKLIGNIPYVKKHGLMLPGGYKYIGPYNDLTKQVDYDSLTGEIRKINDPYKNRLDEVGMFHDIDYDVCANKYKNKKDILNCKHIADRKMTDRIDNFDKKNKTERFVNFLMKGKQKLGLNITGDFVNIDGVTIPHHPLNHFELVKFAKELNINNFQVVDLLFDDYKPGGNYIIFINKDGKIGHYTAFNYDLGFYFDSVGLIPTKNAYKHVKSFNNMRIQGLNRDNALCGHFCLYVLHNLSKHSPEKIVSELENYI